MYRNVLNTWFEKVDDNTMIIYREVEKEDFLPISIYTQKPVKTVIENNGTYTAEYMYYDGYKYHLEEAFHYENGDTVYYLTRTDEFFDVIWNETLLFDREEQTYYRLATYRETETEVLSL